MAVLMANSARVTDESLDGRTVASIRSQYANVYNISSSAPALINGCKVENEATATVRGSDELLFAKPSGEKGVSVAFTAR